MYYFKKDVVFQEVPGEISLCYLVGGCPLRCKGCHSIFCYDETLGKKFKVEKYTETLDKYNGYISCVLFMGGEWHKDELLDYLSIAKNKGLKTCLYTGLKDVGGDIKANLTYLKTGPWIEELGGLNSPTTNQKFVELSTGNDLTSAFQREILAV